MKSHSKTLLWLLVAATVAVDAVAIAWLVQAGPESRAVYLFDALATGQLAVVCVWAVFAARRMWSSLLAIGAAVLTSTALEVWTDSMSARESFGSSASLAGALVATLWILKQTPLWRNAVQGSTYGWQFSVGQVLVVMTLVALLLASLRDTEQVTDSSQLKFLVAMVICDVLIVLTCVLSSAWLREWWLRLAVDVAVATAIGGCLTFTSSAGWLGQMMTIDFRQGVIPLTAYMIVVSLVLHVWLELAPLLPPRRTEMAPPAGGNIR